MLYPLSYGGGGEEATQGAMDALRRTVTDVPRRAIGLEDRLLVGPACAATDRHQHEDGTGGDRRPRRARPPASRRSRWSAARRRRDHLDRGAGRVVVQTGLVVAGRA